MEGLFKVIAKSEVEKIQKNDGSTLIKATIVLQSPGGNPKFEPGFVATLFGNLAECQFYKNDIVWAKLFPSYHEYEGHYYPDCTCQEVINFTNHGA